MFSSSDYELLDFGDGLKLERFGPGRKPLTAPRRPPQTLANRNLRFGRKRPRGLNWPAICGGAMGERGALADAAARQSGGPSRSGR